MLNGDAHSRRCLYVKTICTYIHCDSVKCEEEVFVEGLRGGGPQWRRAGSFARVLLPLSFPLRDMPSSLNMFPFRLPLTII